MNVAVYCSAKDCIGADYLQLGDELGLWLARHGHNLVYGGATGGLMSRVSNAFASVPTAERGQVIGVVPSRIVTMGRRSAHCDLLFEVHTMSERKQRMRDLADCFVCLPGSYGTLDEMFDVIAAGTVGEHHKPLFILNYPHFYDSLQAHAQHMRSLAFLPEQESYSPVYANTMDELVEYINAVRPSR